MLRRDKDETDEIIWDKLTYCRTPRRISHILLVCNLNTKTAKKLLELLVRKGFSLNKEMSM